MELIRNQILLKDLMRIFAISKDLSRNIEISWITFNSGIWELNSMWLWVNFINCQCSGNLFKIMGIDPIIIKKWYKNQRLWVWLKVCKKKGRRSRGLCQSHLMNWRNSIHMAFNQIHWIVDHMNFQRDASTVLILLLSRLRWRTTLCLQRYLLARASNLRLS